MAAYSITVIILVLLVFIRKLNLKKVELKFKYDVYQLRDELRRDAIEGKTNTDNWLFEYFDVTLSKMVSESYYITLFFMIVANFRNESNPNYQVFKEKVFKDIEADEYYKGFHQKLNAVASDYLLRQHFFTTTFLVPIVGLILGADAMRKRFNIWVDKLTIDPQTSASSEYIGEDMRAAA